MKTGYKPCSIDCSTTATQGWSFKQASTLSTAAETYDLFSNPKSPFLQRLVTAPTEQTKLSSEKLESLLKKCRREVAPIDWLIPLQKVRTKNGASLLNFAWQISNLWKSIGFLWSSTTTAFCPVVYGTGALWSKEDPFIWLNWFKIYHTLEEQEIRIRVYDVYRTFRSFDQLLDTLTRISEDTEIENFELFCCWLLQPTQTMRK